MKTGKVNIDARSVAPHGESIESSRVQRSSHRDNGDWMIHVEQRPRPDQEEIILTVPFAYEDDEEDLPIQIELDRKYTKTLDGGIKETYYVPWKYRNMFLEVNYGEPPVPIRFNEQGSGYIELSFKKKDLFHYPVKFYLKDMEKLREILTLLEKAKDICDHCGAPLPLNPHTWLNFSDGGGAIASVFHCQLCDEISIRWEKEFFEDNYETLERLKVE